MGTPSASHLVWHTVAPPSPSGALWVSNCVNQELTGQRHKTVFLAGWSQKSERVFHEGPMPGAGHRFYFVGKVPLAFSVALSLLFANTFLMLFLEFAGKYFLPTNVPQTIHWYEENSITIQFVLLACWLPSSSYFGNAFSTYTESRKRVPVAECPVTQVSM
jgi:hypothetical protein